MQPTATTSTAALAEEVEDGCDSDGDGWETVDENNTSDDDYDREDDVPDDVVDSDSDYCPSPQRKRKKLKLSRGTDTNRGASTRALYNVYGDSVAGAQLDVDSDDEVPVGDEPAAAAKPSNRSEPPTRTRRQKITTDNIVIEGVAQLPPDFAWTTDAPLKEKRNLNPERPLSSTIFLPGSSMKEIFVNMFAPGRRLWIKGTNENGRGLYENWKTLRKKEAYRFISIVVYGGVVRTNRWDTYWLKNSVFSSPFVKRQMTKSRFVKIKNASRLYVESTITAAGANNPSSETFDPIHKVRPMMDALLLSFQRCRAPSAALSIDEQMIKFLGRSKFIVVVKNKPIPRGIKMFVLCDSRSGYIHAAQMHYDHTEKSPDEQCRTIEMFMELLDGTTPQHGRSFLDQGLSVYCDNYFTMVRLFYALRERNTYACGTLRTNRRNLPTGIVSSHKKRGRFMSSMKRGGYVFRFANTEFPMTYCGWQDNGPVHILSTCPDFGRDTEVILRAGRAGSKIKIVQPSVVADYTKHMRGVDLCDQKIAEQKEHHRRSRKWTTSLLYQMIDWTVLNTTVIYNSLSQKPLTSLKAKMQLVMALSSDATGDATGNAAGNHNRNDQHQPTGVPSIDRFNQNLGHYPLTRFSGDKSLRRLCEVHMQRKQINTECEACGVALCPYPCWRRFHTMENYLFDDPTMVGPPIIHRQQRH